MSTAIPSSTRLGRYEIRSLIGTGGMGEVYLAQDTKLERTVALKILPDEVARDQQRMHRFVQEAKSASALNHPNIITIYEIEQANSIHFIATEYIDGQTLRQHMARTRITIPEALDVAIQVASALAAAHEVGIVHRDIKPENVMLRRDGIVKVLDFGLAKLTERHPATTDTEAPTRALVHTDQGMVMGTAAYMSPEQARGQEVDARTDIWSLGVLLYEMVAGRVPFPGQTASDLVASVLKTQPLPLSRYEPEVPAKLEEIVTKALEKNREERYQGVRDLLVDLKRLKKRLEFETELERSTPPEMSGAAAAISSGPLVAQTEPTAATLAAPPTSSAEYIVSEIKRHKLGAIIASLMLAAVVAGVALGLYRLVANRESKTVVPFSTMRVTRLTTNGKAGSAAISPDGKYVVYTMSEAGQQSLWLKQVATNSNVPILPPSEVKYQGLTFSPDGNFVYYVRRDKDSTNATLYQVPVLGGAERKVIEDVDSPITISPDGKRLAFVRFSSSVGESALIVANADGAGETKLATRTLPETFSGGRLLEGGPAWSPDGKVIVIGSATTKPAAGRAAFCDLVEIPVEGGTERLITAHGWGAIGRVAWLVDGSGVLMSAADQSSGYFFQIWFVSYPHGDARRITNDPNNYMNVNLTRDAGTLLTVQSDWLSTIWMASNGDANQARQITSGKFDGMAGVAWTPDGKIVYATRDWDIWIMDANGSNQKLLTLDEHNNRQPSVSPDGRYILFESWRKSSSSQLEQGGVWRMDINGGNPKQLTAGTLFPGAQCSADGKWVIYSSFVSGKPTLWKISIDGGKPAPLTGKPCRGPAISSDGKLIACYYRGAPNAPDKWVIAVLPFEGGEPTSVFEIPRDISERSAIRWTPDGRALAYLVSRGGVSNIWSQPLAGGPPRQLTDFKADEIFHFAWSRDGKQLALARGTINNDVVLISNLK